MPKRSRRKKQHSDPNLLARQIVEEAIGEPFTTTTIDRLQAQLEELRRICGEAYQLAGTVGAPPHVLDILSDAAEGRPTEGRSFLPIGEQDFNPAIALGRLGGLKGGH